MPEIENIGVEKGNASEWLKLEATRPNLIIEIGTSTAGALMKRDVNISMKSGDLKDCRYLGIDKTDPPMASQPYTLGIRMEVGINDEKNRNLQILFGGKTSEIWMANLGGKLDITDPKMQEEVSTFYKEIFDLLQAGGKVLVVDYNTPTIREHKTQILVKLRELFPDITVTDSSTTKSGNSEIDEKVRNHPFIKSFTQEHPTVVLVFEKKA